MKMVDLVYRRFHSKTGTTLSCIRAYWVCALITAVAAPSISAVSTKRFGVEGEKEPRGLFLPNVCPEQGRQGSSVWSVSFRIVVVIQGGKKTAGIPKNGTISTLPMM